MAVASLRLEELTESRSTEIDLDVGTAAALTEIGRRLASDKTWWGGSASEEEQTDSATIVRCSPTIEGRWKVTVDNAIGSIIAGDVHLIVQPKVSTAHLFHLFARGEALPRIEETQSAMRPDDTLLDVVARWFLTAMERLLRGGLMRDYHETRDDLEAVRGRIDPIPTAQLLYSGRLAVVCDFETFDVDTPLNRILKAASRVIVRAPVFAEETRNRAERVFLRMDDVEVMSPTDLDAVALDRRTAGYRDALVLARHLLRLEGRALAAGDRYVQTFLIRTPDLVENGIRAVLAQGMGDQCLVGKRGKRLVGTGLTINPDLVFDPLAVGDVKYKLDWDAWPRSDLYQSVAFAAGFMRDQALVVSFVKSNRPDLPTVRFGEITIANIAWLAADHISPEEAEASLVARARAWWATSVLTGHDFFAA